MQDFVTVMAGAVVILQVALAFLVRVVPLKTPLPLQVMVSVEGLEVGT